MPSNQARDAVYQQEVKVEEMPEMRGDQQASNAACIANMRVKETLER